MIQERKSIMTSEKTSLPLTLTPKRKFTVWLDSSEYVRRGALAEALKDNYLPLGGTGTDNFVFPTFDLYFNLPFALESGSGFWDVSMESFSMGTEVMYSNTTTNQHLYSTNPCFNNLTVNLESSSPYIGFGRGVQDPGIRTEESTSGGISAFDRLLRTNPYRTYGILPVGVANIFDPPSNLIKYTFASNPLDPTTSIYGMLPNTANITISPFNSTIKTNKNTELHVVITSELKRQVEDASASVGKDAYDILKIPYFTLSTVNTGLGSQFPSGTPVLMPFDRNWKCCLCFKEV